jgi:hypothetical protein
MIHELKPNWRDSWLIVFCFLGMGP